VIEFLILAFFVNLDRCELFLRDGYMQLERSGGCTHVDDSKLFIVLVRCPSLKKIILVGYPKQLQPHVPDSVRIQGYEKSSQSMKRIVNRSDKELDDDLLCKGTPYVMLDIQFRMAPRLR
jgi:hypothetical protein